jgi:hypothetical protein
MYYDLYVCCVEVFTFIPSFPSLEHVSTSL